MMPALTTILLWTGALGFGVMAGVYFTFSAFAMQSLDRLGASDAAAAMNAINEVIVRSLFLPLFFATTLIAAAVAVLTIFRPGEPGAAAAIAGGAIYVFGMFAVTVIFNVPLNNRLMVEGAALWPDYLRVWTGWNHVRTVASLLAMAAFIYALAAR